MSEKLEYRLLNAKDASLLFNFNSSLDNLAFVPRSPFKSQEEATLLLFEFLKSMDEKKSIWWSFKSRNSEKSFGYGGLFGIDSDNFRAEIGYGFLKEYWGKGYASFIVDFITNFGFSELKLHRIYGMVDPENRASIRVLEKNGYINEGIMSDYYYARGRFFNMSLLAKISE